MACPLEGFVGRRCRLSKSVINYSSVHQHLAVPWAEDTLEGGETDTLLHKLDISSGVQSLEGTPSCGEPGPFFHGHTR